MISLNLGLGNIYIQNIQFKTKKDLKEYITDIKKPNLNSVWLVCYDDDECDVIITENFDFILKFIDFFKSKKYYLFENESYESAYKVALLFKETSENCYDK